MHFIAIISLNSLVAWTDFCNFSVVILQLSTSGEKYWLICYANNKYMGKKKSRKCPSAISPAVISRGPGFPLPCADTTDWHCQMSHCHMAQCSSGFSSLGACSGSFSWHVVLQVAESWSCASGCLLVWSCKAVLYFSAPYYHPISQQKGERNGKKAKGLGNSVLYYENSRKKHVP